VDGVTPGEGDPLEAERTGKSPAPGGYPAVAGREPDEPDGPAEGAEAAGASADDDGVFHTESRPVASLAE
jgi:hypothetical protein